ncbi:hypothetical protein E3N88_39746 [Mikania micrantha]|uniref:Protein yippee-like n=1 Tax=Mikania micrantha TaxID=192012 RepID=A0A5N6LIL0_9ASTR|nr:hypothetical protein E3N88_42141 [Mikania micrantha]KAD2392769.1 hypothetical protein E3N88_39746 [Mikania micrantha]
MKSTPENTDCGVHDSKKKISGHPTRNGSIVSGNFGGKDLQLQALQNPSCTLRRHCFKVLPLQKWESLSLQTNVTVGVKEDRMMMTGLHTVADIFCVKCGSIVGWTYETAHEKNQKYKEGKSVLERFKLSGPDGSSYWVNHETQIIQSEHEEV